MQKKWITFRKRAFTIDVYSQDSRFATADWTKDPASLMANSSSSIHGDWIPIRLRPFPTDIVAVSAAPGRVLIGIYSIQYLRDVVMVCVEREQKLALPAALALA